MLKLPLTVFKNPSGLVIRPISGLGVLPRLVSVFCHASESVGTGKRDNKLRFPQKAGSKKHLEYAHVTYNNRVHRRNLRVSESNFTRVFQGQKEGPVTCCHSVATCGRFGIYYSKKIK